MDNPTSPKEHISLRKIVTKDGKFYLLVKDRIPHDMKICLSDGKDTWLGKVTLGTLKDLAKQLEMEENEYVKLSVDALQPQSESKQQSTFFDVKQGAEGRKLIWKQEMDKGIKLQLGSIVLEKEMDKDFPVGGVLDVAVEHFSSLNSNIRKLQQANDQLLQERERALKRLEDCVTVKENIERELYQKFAVVLNDKKAKIRELKQEVLDLQTNGPRNAQENSDGEDSVDGDEDTDEEKRREEETRIDTAKKGNRSNDIEESLLLATNDNEEEAIPTVKRRRAAKRQKTSRLTAIPRTTSLPRPQKRDSLSPPLRVGSQSKSKGSDPQFDADQLMDQL